jgi:hypothetical protein
MQTLTCRHMQDSTHTMVTKTRIVCHTIWPKRWWHSILSSEKCTIFVSLLFISPKSCPFLCLSHSNTRHLFSQTVVKTNRNFSTKSHDVRETLLTIFAVVFLFWKREMTFIVHYIIHSYILFRNTDPTCVTHCIHARLHVQ